MGQYGAFIGLICSATSVALVLSEQRISNGQKQQINPDNIPSKIDFSPLLAEIVQKAAEKHLDALQPGSSEYFETLEMYGRLLSEEITPSPTSTRKMRTSHHRQGGHSI
jgi:hypothetical protein